MVACIGAGAIELARARATAPPNFWQRGTEGTTQIYRGTRKKFTVEHGPTTLGSFSKFLGLLTYANMVWHVRATTFCTVTVASAWKSPSGSCSHSSPPDWTSATLCWPVFHNTHNVLQRVQNAADQLIFNLGPRDHVTDIIIIIKVYLHKT